MEQKNEKIIDYNIPFNIKIGLDIQQNNLFFSSSKQFLLLYNKIMDLGFDFIVMNVLKESEDDSIVLSENLQELDICLLDSELSNSEIFSTYFHAKLSKSSSKYFENNEDLSKIILNLETNHVQYLNIKQLHIFINPKINNTTINLLTDNANKYLNIILFFPLGLSTYNEFCNFLLDKSNVFFGITITKHISDSFKLIKLNEVKEYIKLLCSFGVKLVRYSKSFLLEVCQNTSDYKKELEIIKLLMEYKVDIIIESECLNDISLLLTKLTGIFLFHKKYSLKQSHFNKYEDFFQIPIQPLRDDLPSNIYESFEEDSIKYNYYEKAIRKVISNKFIKTIGLLGAGRGPILKRLLNIKEIEKILIIAVEKNYSAFNNLKFKYKEFKNITILFGDMRNLDVILQLNHIGKLDLIISELLGSFGDNELSPECLLNAETKCLNYDGIMIPESYSSYITPASYYYCYKYLNEKERQTPYVNLAKNYFNLTDLKPQEVFTFKHPCNGSNDFEKKKTINFSIAKLNDNFRIENFICHGFLAYFETVLYEDIILSTNPISLTIDMYSWFPMYFPINKQILLMSNDNLTVEFLRTSYDKYVWYEWEVFLNGKSVSKNNLKGEFYKIEK